MTGKQQGARDRGAAAIELALLLPVFLVLVFGLIDFGRMLNDQIQVTNAAREAVRMEALQLGPDAQTRVDAATTLGADAHITDATACTAESEPTDAASATVTYDFHFITPLGAFADLALPDPVQLSSTATMRCGG